MIKETEISTQTITWLQKLIGVVNNVTEIIGENSDVIMNDGTMVVKIGSPIPQYPDGLLVDYDFITDVEKRLYTYILRAELTLHGSVDDEVSEAMRNVEEELSGYFQSVDIDDTSRFKNRTSTIVRGNVVKGSGGSPALWKCSIGYDIEAQKINTIRRNS